MALLEPVYLIQSGAYHQNKSPSNFGDQSERPRSVAGDNAAFAVAVVSVYSLVCCVILCNLDVQTQHVFLGVTSRRL